MVPGDGLHRERPLLDIVDAAPAHDDTKLTEIDIYEELDTCCDDSAGLETTSDSTSATLELVLWTFNLLNPFGGGGDVNKRTQIVIDAIMAEQPDLIAFQEVINSGSVPNRAEFIAQATGYYWTWKQEYSVFIYDEGIAILSKWPILDTESVELPHKDLILFTRFALAATVESPVGPVDFYCTHMTVGGSETQSADQALAAYNFITERSVGVPAFFAGDLNAEPDTLAMGFLRGEATHNGVTGDFTDAWPAVNPTSPGLTISSDDLHDRIDYIYVADTVPQPPEPVECKLLFDEKVDGVYASDHLGVSCKMNLGG